MAQRAVSCGETVPVPAGQEEGEVAAPSAWNPFITIRLSPPEARSLRSLSHAIHPACADCQSKVAKSCSPALTFLKILSPTGPVNTRSPFAVLTVTPVILLPAQARRCVDGCADRCPRSRSGGRGRGVKSSVQE
ncbi:unnamed protein product [Pleuronectes platessa]|uniref:Uncharacterized protein n=1 Tax=Pleuronectes platessa TaxID=8262 RepID=A0A9N7V6K0_PLEPL|nr:unnamed protein product [Pleuronectes platessa]